MTHALHDVPLTEIVLPDGPPVTAAPAPPKRRARTRAGNGMGRSRAGILSGAARCIAKYGTRKTTMGDIADTARIARATLYNHFRTKRDVYAALVADEVDDLLGQIAGLGAPAGSAESVVSALAFAADWLSEHPVLRALREREPDLAARLARPVENDVWAAVRQAALQRVTLAVAAGGLHPRTDPAVAVETLLRWVVSYVTWPAAAPGAAEAAARLVVDGLRTAPSGAPAAPARVAPRGRATAANAYFAGRPA